LTEFVGVAQSDDEIAALKQRLWTRPVGDPGHLWKPGRDKWKEYLTPRSLAILCEEGIGEIMAELGYDFAAQATVAAVPVSAEPPWRPPAHGVDFFTSCIGSVEAALAEFAANIGECCYTKARDMTFVSTSARALQAFDAYANETDLLKLVAAGQIDSLRMPSRLI
jgi:hypothetical protein